jgi:hypothetical protein
LGFGFLLSGISVGVGWALFKVAMLRVRIYPRAAAIILISAPYSYPCRYLLPAW